MRRHKKEKEVKMGLYQSIRLRYSFLVLVVRKFAKNNEKTLTTDIISANIKQTIIVLSVMISEN